MKISTKGRYGLLIMLNLASEYKNDTFISLGDIADKEHTEKSNTSAHWQLEKLDV